jgi:diguanylate cyclase (GGDEF)-like protein
MKDKPVVLLVDDSKTNIQILAACLKDNYQLQYAKNGEECLNLSKEQPQPDLILLDVEMPGISGYEVCKQLKASDQTLEIPVIFVTAREANVDEEKGLSLGAVDYITKPIHPAIVSARVSTHVTLKLQRDILKNLALRDQLTGLYNRYFLLDIAKKKVAQAIRHQQPFCLLMIDIDHFKQINDTHGHLTGDAILKAVSKYLSKGNRQEDVVARFGGEEFVFLLDQCQLSDAEEKAEVIRRVIESLKPHGIKVTISIGLAEFDEEIDLGFTELLKRADDALYLAKEQGRNRVCIG